MIDSKSCFLFSFDFLALIVVSGMFAGPETKAIFMAKKLPVNLYTAK